MAKNSVNKIEKQPMELEEIFANHDSDKGLIPKIYKELLQFNSEKVNKPFKKWAKDFNRWFSKEDTQTHTHVDRYMAGCPESLTIRRTDVRPQ